MRKGYRAAKAKCPLCGKVCAVTVNATLFAHRALNGGYHSNVDLPADSMKIKRVPHRARGPQIQIRCACGALWQRGYAVNNPIIDTHRERQRQGKGDCMVGQPEPIPIKQPKQRNSRVVYQG